MDENKNDRNKRLERQRNYYWENKEKRNFYYNTIYKPKRRERENRLKYEVFSHYSNGIPKCECCNENILILLNIDHINGGGKKHLKKMGIWTGYSFYLWLKRNSYPLEYRVLCWNCNIGRQHNNGICPHKS